MKSICLERLLCHKYDDVEMMSDRAISHHNLLLPWGQKGLTEHLYTREYPEKGSGDGVSAVCYTI